MILEAKRASTTTKLASVKVYGGHVPINTGNSIILSDFVLDLLNSTKGVATG